jgi:calcium-independent phospholipase A2
MKFGGTPLHWSCSREVIETLISMGCDINSRNFDGRTALHIMVLRNRLECVVALLSHEANTDIGDHDGNTPLHLAVTLGSFAIVQALIVFGADLSYKYEYLRCYLHFSALIR